MKNHEKPNPKYPKIRWRAHNSHCSTGAQWPTPPGSYSLWSRNLHKMDIMRSAVVQRKHGITTGKPYELLKVFIVPRRTGDQTESKTEETIQSRVWGISSHLSHLGMYPHVYGFFLIVGHLAKFCYWSFAWSSSVLVPVEKNPLLLFGIHHQTNIVDMQAKGLSEKRLLQMGNYGNPLEYSGCPNSNWPIHGQPGPTIRTCFSLIMLGTRATNIWQAST